MFAQADYIKHVTPRWNERAACRHPAAGGRSEHHAFLRQDRVDKLVEDGGRSSSHTISESAITISFMLSGDDGFIAASSGRDQWQSRRD